MAIYTNVQIIPQDILKKYIMYSKEHIKPKLHQLDQDKLARLYADLRRESLATGSFPITVRHLESMIRMSEASAKMHLREYVRSDDIDLAIQVTVGSFVNAQKMSIKKTLERVSLSSFLSITFTFPPLSFAQRETRRGRGHKLENEVRR
jgi:DNA replication licensing factor MCM2